MIEFQHGWRLAADGELSQSTHRDVRVNHNKSDGDIEIEHYDGEIWIPADALAAFLRANGWTCEPAEIGGER